MRSPKALMSQNVCLNVTAILGASVLMLCGGTAALAQIPPAAPAQHAMTDPADQNKQLLDQIAELRSGLSERSHSRSSTRLAADASYSVRSFDAAIWGARVGPI